MARAIKINKRDNVAVCVESVKKGEVVSYGVKERVVARVVALTNVKAGHKIAIKPIKKGSYVIKYGEIIGVAIEDISEGAHVHTHNMVSARAKEEQ